MLTCPELLLDFSVVHTAQSLVSDVVFSRPLFFCWTYLQTAWSYNDNRKVNSWQDKVNIIVFQ